jgi:hypothetical protein
MYAQTTDATPTVMDSYAATGEYPLRDDCLSALRITVAGRKSDGSVVSVWAIDTAFERDSGTERVVGTPVATLVAQDAGAAAWACGVATSANGFKITVTGAAATTVDWTATIDITEVF